MGNMTRHPELEADLRQRLSKHPLYSLDHYVLAIGFDDRKQFQYRSTESPVESMRKTKFDFDILNDIGDINLFFIGENCRKQGHGTALYQIIEKFCIDKGCTKIITTPSGQGKIFWPKMGFIEKREHLVEKAL